MGQIKNKEYSGERSLFAMRDLQLENVTIHIGESSLKECGNILAVNRRFEGKFLFWHNDRFVVKNCFFIEGVRVALWHFLFMHNENILNESCKITSDYKLWLWNEVTLCSA